MNIKMGSFKTLMVFTYEHLHTWWCAIHNWSLIFCIFSIFYSAPFHHFFFFYSVAYAFQNVYVCFGYFDSFYKFISCIIMESASLKDSQWKMQNFINKTFQSNATSVIHFNGNILHLPICFKWGMMHYTDLNGDYVIFNSYIFLT